MMICNMCHAAVGEKDAILVTICMHMYCIACAETHFAKTERCKCGKHLEPDDVNRVSREEPERKAAALSLAGMGPDAIMRACQYGIAFWERQAQLRGQYIDAKLTGAEKQYKDIVERLKKAEQDVKLRDDRIQVLEQRAKRVDAAHRDALATYKTDSERVVLGLQTELHDAQKALAGMFAGKAGGAALPTTPPLTPFKLDAQTPDGMGLPWGNDI